MGFKVAIVGTGNVGSALGVRFSRVGVGVRFGARRPGELEALLERCDGRAKSFSQQEAVEDVDVVFLAVPGSAAVEVVRSLGVANGTIVVDCTNPLSWDDGPLWAPPPEGSNAAAIAAAVPGARLVKAFNTFGAEFHLDPVVGDRGVDVYLAGDDDEAKGVVSSIATTAGFRPIDSGPLRNAALLENLAMLWIHLAMVGGKGREFVFQLTERDA